MNPLSDETKSDETPVRKVRADNGMSILGIIGRFVLLLIVGSIAILAGALFQGYLYFTSGLPSIETLKNYAPPTVSCVYDAKGQVIAEFACQRRFVVPIDVIPRHLQQAFVAAEDKNFWNHYGHSRDKEMWLIFWMNLTGRRLYSGGISTITQQTAKNFLLTPEKKCTRKIKEAILSRWIENALTKKEILYLYLNEMYLGSGAYGVEAAAREYFGKHVQELTIAECAMLAGLSRAPGRNSPRANLQKAMERRTYVLKRMMEDKYISQEQYAAAMSEEPILTPKQPLYPVVAQDFVEYVRRYVKEKYGSDALYKEGLQIYTTWNPDMPPAGVDAKGQGLRDPAKPLGVASEEQGGAVSMLGGNGSAMPKAWIIKIVDRTGRVLEQDISLDFADDPVPLEKP